MFSDSNKFWEFVSEQYPALWRQTIRIKGGISADDGCYRSAPNPGKLPISAELFDIPSLQLGRDYFSFGDVRIHARVLKMFSQFVSLNCAIVYIISW